MEKSVHISSHLWTFLLLYKIVHGLPTFADAWFSFYIRRFQIFRIIKFASWIFVFLVLILSFVKVNLLGSFFAKMRALTRFLFVVLVAKFAGFREQKKYRAYDRFHGNGPYGKIPTKKEPIRTHGFTSRLSCHVINRGYYTVARRYEFYFRVAKQYFTNERSEWVKYCFCHEKIKSYLEAAV